jgi:sulfite exporter TauE/SafE
VQVWSAFVTGLVAGGASCAAVQGGLLAGLLERRAPAPPAPARPAGTAPKRARGKAAAAARGRPATTQAGRPAKGTAKRPAPPPPASWREDLRPVSAFLLGKLASHTLLGAALGALGSAVQLGIRTRAAMQIAAGVIMIVLALDLLGIRAVRGLVPQPPAAFVRLVRRNAKSQALVAPATLGVLTVLIPCGVTLSVELLAVTSGSPLIGAAIMAAFVAGTSPLFAMLGFVIRRSATALRGRLATASAVVVALVGVLSVNTGLVLIGSPFTLSAAAAALTPRSDRPAPASGNAAGKVDFGLGDAQIDAGGVQQIIINARNSSYTPSRVRAKAGVPTVLTVRTDRTRGCTRAFVIPDANIERVLPETGDTRIELGALPPGELKFTCGMGMYRGYITVT